MKRLWQPYLFQVNFQDVHWQSSPATTKRWLAAAVIAGLVTQFFVGYFNVLTVLLTIAFPAFLAFYMPPVLAAAFGGTLMVQAIGSLILMKVLLSVGIPYALRELAGSGWVLFNVAVNLAMALRYLRTPKDKLGRGAK